LRSYNFIIPTSFFSANDFIKKNCFFVPLVLINGIKIYRAIIFFSGGFFPADIEGLKALIRAMEVIKWICFVWNL